MAKTKSKVDPENLQIASDVLRAISHPLRLKILGFIDQHKTINVNRIYNTLKLEQSITSQHLRILRNAGLVITERDGKFIFYTIDYKKVAHVLKSVNEFLGV